MSNFNIRKFLTENKLTETSKRLAEADLDSYKRSINYPHKNAGTRHAKEFKTTKKDWPDNIEIAWKGKKFSFHFRPTGAEDNDMKQWWAKHDDFGAEVWTLDGKPKWNTIKFHKV